MSATYIADLKNVWRNSAQILASKIAGITVRIENGYVISIAGQKPG